MLIKIGLTVKSNKVLWNPVKKKKNNCQEFLFKYSKTFTFYFYLSRYMAVKCCVADDDVIVQYEVYKKKNILKMKSVVSQDSKDVGFKKTRQFHLT